MAESGGGVQGTVGDAEERARTRQIEQDGERKVGVPMASDDNEGYALWGIKGQRDSILNMCRNMAR